jgi:hypothetical protein
VVRSGLAAPPLSPLPAALIDWESCEHEDDRRAIVRQVLAALSIPSAAHPDIRRAA